MSELFQIHQCAKETCRFRFPAEASVMEAQQCPRCGAPTAVVQAPFTHYTPAAAPASPRPLHALLDNIRSIHNVGSIFRSADGAGVGHLYLCGITATPQQPKLAKAALGAHETVAWSYHENGWETAVFLKKAGHPIYALETTPTAIPLQSFTPSSGDGPAPVLIVGNEKAGVDPGLLALADSILALPMCGQKSSLNVAVAFGIAVYHLAFP